MQGEQARANPEHPFSRPTTSDAVAGAHTSEKAELTAVVWQARPLRPLFCCFFKNSKGTGVSFSAVARYQEPYSQTQDNGIFITRDCFQSAAVCLDSGM
jgi:hypothetical protein